MNRFEGCGIVGCWFINWWRTADEFEDDTQLSSSAGEASRAVRALAADASAAFADRRFVVERSGESGGHLWPLPHCPSTAGQLLCPAETGRRGLQYSCRSTERESGGDVHRVAAARHRRFGR